MAALIAEFTVVGTPVPQGSTRAFSRGGKIHTTNDPTGTIERWRGDIRSALRDAVGPGGLPDVVDQPVSMRLAFRLPRPKSHFLPIAALRREPMLRSTAPTWAAGKDLDKLVRACLDALTGLCYRDDSLVAVIGATKAYANPGEQPGVDVRVSAL